MRPDRRDVAPGTASGRAAVVALAIRPAALERRLRRLLTVSRRGDGRHSVGVSAALRQAVGADLPGDDCRGGRAGRSSCRSWSSPSRSSTWSPRPMRSSPQRAGSGGDPATRQLPHETSALKVLYLQLKRREKNKAGPTGRMNGWRLIPNVLTSPTETTSRPTEPIPYTQREPDRPRQRALEACVGQSAADGVGRLGERHRGAMATVRVRLAATQCTRTTWHLAQSVLAVSASTKSR